MAATGRAWLEPRPFKGEQQPAKILIPRHFSLLTLLAFTLPHLTFPSPIPIFQVTQQRRQSSHQYHRTPQRSYPYSHQQCAPSSFLFSSSALLPHSLFLYVSLMFGVHHTQQHTSQLTLTIVNSVTAKGTHWLRLVNPNLKPNKWMASVRR